MLDVLDSGLNGQPNSVLAMGMRSHIHAPSRGFVANGFHFFKCKIKMFQMIRGRDDSGAGANFHEIRTAGRNFPHPFPAFPWPVHNT